jgi:TolB-like protein
MVVNNMPAGIIRKEYIMKDVKVVRGFLVNGFLWLAYFIMASTFFLGCASTKPVSLREMSSADKEKAEILGQVQTTLSRRTQAIFGVIPIINKQDLEAEAYGALMTKASGEFKGSIDIYNIKLVLNRKETKLTALIYHYIATGDVIALNTNTARAAGRLDAVSIEVANAFQGSKNNMIAILDFTNIDGRKSVLGRYLAEQTSNNLFRNSDLRFVERAQINKVIDEMKFGTSGFVSDESAVRIGQLLGADAVVLGTLTRIGRRISVSLKVVETKSGRILSSGTTEIEGEEFIEMYNDILK